MNQKKDSTKLKFFNESVLQRMEIEVNRVSQLYKADRIGGIRGHEMLHTATKDLNSIFWQVSAMISQEHHKIDFLHKVKRSMGLDLQGPQYLSNPTIEARSDPGFFVINPNFFYEIQTLKTPVIFTSISQLLFFKINILFSRLFRVKISDSNFRNKLYFPVLF